MLDLTNKLTLDFKVNKQIISFTDLNQVVEGSVDFLYAVFTFSDEWLDPAGSRVGLFYDSSGTSGNKKPVQMTLEKVNDFVPEVPAVPEIPATETTPAVPAVPAVPAIPERWGCKVPAEVIKKPRFYVSACYYNQTKVKKITANLKPITVVESGCSDGSVMPLDPTLTTYNSIGTPIDNTGAKYMRLSNGELQVSENKIDWNLLQATLTDLPSSNAVPPVGTKPIGEHMQNDRNSFKYLYGLEDIAKRVKITMPTGWGDYQKAVIILHKLATATTGSESEPRTRCSGVFTFSREVGASYKVQAQVITGSGFIKSRNQASMVIQGADIEVNTGYRPARKLKFVEFDYQGNRYLGLDIYIATSYISDVYFTGTIGGRDIDANALVCVSYYNTQTSAVLNEEINGSIADFVSAPVALLFNGEEIATKDYVRQARSYLLGVDYDETASSPVLTRTYDAVGMVANVGMSLTDKPRNDFDGAFPFNGMVIDKINGRVMIGIPKFYVKRERYQKNGIWHRGLSISRDRYDDSYVPHEAFLMGDKQYNGHHSAYDYNDYVWIARYETSANNQSVSGAAVQVNQTRATMRNNARAIGNGWSMLDLVTWDLQWLLFHIEFANRNSQSIMLGNQSGVVSPTGLTDGALASSVQIGGNVAATSKASCYRGIENMDTNVFKWVDGVNTNNRQAYVCTDITKYADDTENGYRKLAYMNALADGYIKELGFDESNPFAQFPTEVGGASNTFFADYYAQGDSVRTLRVGGYFGASPNYGISGCNVSFSPSNTYAGTGSRLIYRPFAA